MRQWDYPARERGDSDHDQPYRFGRTPSSSWPFPFTMRELVKLTLVKLRVRADGELVEADRPAAEAPENVAAAEAPLD